jgi:hypothetical protein
MGEREVAAEIEAFLRSRGVLPEIARYRYWETPDGWQFHYTTEQLADGKYASAQYIPTGKGARGGKGKVTQLEIRRALHHATRRGAKARAYKLYQKHLKELSARTERADVTCEGFEPQEVTNG